MSATTDAPLPDTDYGQHSRQSGQILSLRRREAPVAAGTGSSRATVPCRCRRVLDLGCVPSQIAKNTAVIIRNRPNTPLVPWRTSVDPPHLLREDANFLDRRSQPTWGTATRRRTVMRPSTTLTRRRGSLPSSTGGLRCRVRAGAMRSRRLSCRRASRLRCSRCNAQGPRTKPELSARLPRDPARPGDASRP